MGKSTVLGQAVQAVTDHATVATGRAERVAEGADVLLPFRDVVVELVGDGKRLPKGAKVAGKRLARGAAELMPEMVGVIFPPLGLVLKAGMLGHGALRELKEDDTARADFTGGLEAFIEALPPDRPVVVGVDDFHWADEPTSDLALYLARRVDHDRFHLALFTRPREEQAPHVATALGELARLAAFDEIDLREFGGADVQRVLEERFPSCIVDARIASLLSARSGGNPYFLQRWVSHLVRAGALGADNGLLHLDERALDAVPEGLEPILDAELAGIDQTSRALLDAAAVLGEAFDPSMAAALAEVDESTGLRSLTSLERSTGWLEATGELLRFEHALLRDHIYRQIPARLRRRYHSMAGDLLFEAAAPPAVVGHHFREAGRLDDAAVFLLDAAEEDLARGAYRSAAERLQGLDAPEAKVEPSRFYLTQVRAEVGAGDVVAALRTLAGWAAAGGPLPPDGLLQEAEARHLDGEYEVARQIVEPLRQEGVPQAVIRSLHYLRFTDPRAAEKEADEVDQSEFTDAQRRQLAYVVAANVWLLRDRLDEAHDQLSRLLEASIAARHDEQAAACGRRLAELAMFRGDLTQADALVRDARERAELSGSRQRVYLLATAAELARHRGDPALAAVLLAAARGQIGLLGIPLWQGHVELSAAEVERSRSGDWRSPLNRARSVYSAQRVAWGVLHCDITDALGSNRGVEELASRAEGIGALTEARWLAQLQDHERHPIMFL